MKRFAKSHLLLVWGFFATLCIAVMDGRNFQHFRNASNIDDFRNLYIVKENKQENIAEELLSFLEVGEKEIELNPEHKNVVFLIGVEGVGKTTLLKFIANDSSRLVSRRMGSGKYAIVDEMDPSIEFPIPQKFLPRFIFNEDINTAFYDLPGFADNRHGSVNFAVAHFIKKVVIHARSVKIIIAVSHESFNVGNRQQMVYLFANLLDFFKDVAPFNGSFALVGIKSTSNRDPAIVINSYGIYLNGMVRDLLGDIYTGDDREKALLIVDYLLYKNGDGSYAKLGYFEEPSAEGLLEMFPQFVANKAYLRRLVTENLSFSSSFPEYFGHSNLYFNCG